MHQIFLLQKTVKWQGQNNKFDFTKTLEGWCPKFATGLNTIIGCTSKSIRVIKLCLCQNDPLKGESFWQKDSLITHILFELQPIMIFSPVANFGHHPLLLQTILGLRSLQYLFQSLIISISFPHVQENQLLQDKTTTSI